MNKLSHHVSVSWASNSEASWCKKCLLANVFETILNSQNFRKSWSHQTRCWRLLHGLDLFFASIIWGRQKVHGPNKSSKFALKALVFSSARRTLWPKTIVGPGCMQQWHCCSWSDPWVFSFLKAKKPSRVHPMFWTLKNPTKNTLKM